MRRTLIQLDEDTHRRLRQEAFRRERSISSLVREFVEKGLQPETPRPRRFASVAAGRTDQARLTPVSEKHDQALADAIER